ncbi:MAG: hypothetical protein CMH60_00460 [Myxococcales bacterium]|nr:hypothetical protein [Myxococcales bacterium]
MLWQNRSGRVLLTVLGGLLLSLVALLQLHKQLTSDLPTITELENYNPPQSTLVYSDEGQLIGRYEREFRRVVPLEKIPEHVIKAFLAAEDADFYNHEGLDYWGILRAVVKNLRPGAHLQGASTITQQIVKTMIVGSERSYKRKVREAILARRLEQSLSKEHILYIYLNQIYFGSGAYGVEAAAQSYFDKGADKLTVGEAAYLAAIPKNPSRYVLDKDPAAAKERQIYVLKQMFAHGWLEQADMEEFIRKPVPGPPGETKNFQVSASYVEHVRRTLSASFSSTQLLDGGLKIYTGLSLKAQYAAHQALRQGLETIARSQGFPGARQRLEADVFPEYLNELHRVLDERIDKLSKVYAAPRDKSYYLWNFDQLDLEEGLALAGLRRSMVVLPLSFGMELKVPIREVNSIDDYVEFDLGQCGGRVNLQALKWARPFSPAEWTPAPKDPSELVRRGDFLRVRVLGKEKTKESKDDCRLSLEVVPEPLVQGALVAIDPHTFMVNAMLGGYSNQGNGFNRITQALRQPGSAFKPVVYAAALNEKKIHQATLCADTPIVVHDVVSGEVWKPQNYQADDFSGNITEHFALARSKNTCAVKLFQKLGSQAVIETAQGLGIQSDLPDSLSLALGAGEVKPLELARVYATFAAGGFGAEPIFVRKVVDGRGKVLLEKKRNLSASISPQTAFLLTDMLKGVFSNGTARRYANQTRSFAGKTGTTDDSRDTWFAGYSPEQVALTWVGFDDNQSLGKASGASHALPIWAEFMETVLEDAPRREFAEPPEIVFLNVNPNNGTLAESEQSIRMAFHKDNLPSEQTQEHDSIFIADDESQNALLERRP